MNAQWRIVKPYSCFYLGARWVCFVNATFRPLYHKERNLICILQEVLWAQGRSGLMPPPRFDVRTIQTVASPYIDCGIMRLA
jgi:hypothetical protein